MRRETLAHITNNCEVALNQGRWNFRHDSVLNFVSSCIERMEGMEVYIDIPGQQTTAAGTVPPSITVTAEKPDIFIIDRRPPRNSVHLTLGPTQVTLGPTQLGMGYCGTILPIWPDFAKQTKHLLATGGGGHCGQNLGTNKVVCLVCRRPLGSRI